jgi:hypothetical protein
MNQVTSIHSQVNDPSLDDVLTWLAAQAKKADIGEASANVRATAIRSLAEMFAEGEPNHAQAFLDNIDHLAHRWAVKHQDMKASTVQTYVSRARSTVVEYFKWRENPAGYRPAPASIHKSAPKAEKPAPAVEAPAVNASAAPPAKDPSPPPPMGDLRKCSLGGGRTFEYLMPADGLQLRDAVRVAFHLITSCDDYDPMAGSPAQVFASLEKRNA